MGDLKRCLDWVRAIEDLRRELADMTIALFAPHLINLFHCMPSVDTRVMYTGKCRGCLHVLFRVSTAKRYQAKASIRSQQMKGKYVPDIRPLPSVSKVHLHHPIFFNADT